MMVQEDTAGNAVKARAGAMTKAVRDVELQGYARTVDAASLGRGLPAAQATQQQIATSAGTAGVSAGTAALGAAQSGNTTMQQGFQTAISGNTAAGNLYGQAAQIEQSANNSMLGLLGSAGGSAAYFLKSDKGVKKNTGRMADTARALAEVEKTPVQEGWEYDPAKGGPDEAGQQHIGSMAQDVRRVSGEHAAVRVHGVAPSDPRRPGRSLCADLK